MFTIREIKKSIENRDLISNESKMWRIVHNINTNNHRRKHAPNRYCIDNESYNDGDGPLYQYVQGNKIGCAIIFDHDMYESRHNIFYKSAYFKSTLKNLLLKRKLKDFQKYIILKQICKCVRDLHESRIVHRGLTLDSVLIDDNLNVVLTNFQLAGTCSYNNNNNISSNNNSSNSDTDTRSDSKDNDNDIKENNMENEDYVRELVMKMIDHQWIAPDVLLGIKYNNNKFDWINNDIFALHMIAFKIGLRDKHSDQRLDTNHLGYDSCAEKYFKIGLYGITCMDNRIDRSSANRNHLVTDLNQANETSMVMFDQAMNKIQWFCKDYLEFIKHGMNHVPTLRPTISKMIQQLDQFISVLVEHHDNPLKNSLSKIRAFDKMLRSCASNYNNDNTKLTDRERAKRIANGVRETIRLLRDDMPFEIVPINPISAASPTDSDCDDDDDSSEYETDAEYDDEAVRYSRNQKCFLRCRKNYIVNEQKSIIETAMNSGNNINEADERKLKQIFQNVGSLLLQKLFIIENCKNGKLSNSISYALWNRLLTSWVFNDDNFIYCTCDDIFACIGYDVERNVCKDLTDLKDEYIYKLSVQYSL